MVQYFKNVALHLRLEE